MSAQWKVIGLTPPTWVGGALDAVGKATTAVATLADTAALTAKIAGVFALSVEEPTKVIVDVLKREVDALSQDLAKAGGYVAGDWGQVRYPFTQLQGGYPLYEQRMVARLLDQNDPLRPSFSSSSVVTAAFFYTESPDAQGLDQVISAIMGLRSLFQQPAGALSSPQPSATSVEVVPEPPDAELPVAFRVRWKAPQSAILPPGGYVVSVSTTLGGFGARVYVPTPSSPPTETGPTNFYPIVDSQGVPLKIYGGADQIKPLVATAVSNGAQIEESTLSTVLITPDGKPISPQIFSSRGKTRVGQRLFRLNQANTLLRWPTRNFSLVIKRSDLPQQWDIPTAPNAGYVAKTEVSGEAQAYYVRVAPVSSTVASSAQGWEYDLDEAAQKARIGQSPEAPLPEGLSPSGLGPWSQPVTLRIPHTNSLKLQEALTVALALVVLTRSDLAINPEVSGSSAALLPTGLEIFAPKVNSLLGVEVLNWCAKAGLDPRTYRAILWGACDKVARDIVARSDLSSKLADSLASRASALTSTVVVEMVREAAEPEASASLQSGGFGSATILDLLRPASATEEDQIRSWIAAGATGEVPAIKTTLSLNETIGVCPSPLSAGFSAELCTRALTTPGVLRVTAPHFPSGSVQASSEIIVENVAAPDAPLLIDSSSPGVAAVYKRYQRIDGSILLPKMEADRLRKLLARVTSVTSAAAHTPVLAVRSDLIRSAMVAEDLTLEPKKAQGAGLLCLRSLLATAKQSSLMTQASTLLGTMLPATSKPATQSEWASVRLSQIVPGLEVGLKAASNWLGSASRAATGVSETTKSYIDGATRAANTAHDLSDRLKTSLTSLIGGSIPLPNFSVLVVSGRGVGEVVSELLGATGKPASTKNSYGGGAVLMLGGAPGFLFDVLGLSTDIKSTTDETQTQIII